MRIYTAYLLRLISASLVISVSSNVFAGPSVDNRVGANSYHSGMNRALENLIDQYTTQRKYKQSISKLEEEIKRDPSNTALLYKEASIYADIEEYDKAKEILTRLIKIQPENEQATKLLKMVDKKIKEQPHNEIGLDQDQAYVSDLKAYWTYSSFHYYHFNQMGTFGGRINYANRYGTNGVQYQIEAYPKLSDNIYANLSFAYANTSQILFPNTQYRVEPFVNLSHGFEASLGYTGQKYITFDHQNINSYTGSIGKYFDNYFIWYRPSYYQPTSTTFNEISLRRYFSDKKTYITVKLSSGRLPDIGDLPPIDKIIVVRQSGINVDGEYSLTKSLFLRAGIGYTRQDFISSNLLREITNGTLGFIYQY